MNEYCTAHAPTTDQRFRTVPLPTWAIGRSVIHTQAHQGLRILHVDRSLRSLVGRCTSLHYSSSQDNKASAQSHPFLLHRTIPSHMHPAPSCLHAHAPARCIPSCCPPLVCANRPPAWPTVTHPTLTADLRTVGRSTVSTQPHLRYPFHAHS